VYFFPLTQKQVFISWCWWFKKSCLRVRYCWMHTSKPS